MLGPVMAELERLLTRDDVERAAAAYLETPEPDRGPLSDLAFEVLSRQAEGRTLFSGADYVRTRASVHGVAAGVTPGGDLVAILERGARSPAERGLVAAFAIGGLGRQLRTEDAATVVFRFVRHADWLEVATPYGVYAFADRLLPAEAVAMIHAEIRATVLDEGAGRDGRRASVRARNAARLTALAESDHPSGKRVLLEIAEAARVDDGIRRLAVGLGGRVPSVLAPAPTPTVSGRLGRHRSAGPRSWLSWVTGWSVLRALGRLLGLALRRRATGEVTFRRGAIEVRVAREILGRTAEESEAIWRLEAVDAVRRRTRYAGLLHYVGALGLAAGVLVGGLLLFDAARTGELWLLMIAAGVIALGAGLDLGLELWAARRPGEVALELEGADGRVLVLERVDAEQAAAFLDALA
jgi:hypothetical protein